jgi:hypothetical protein
MGVRGESGSWFDDIIVEYSQCAELDVVRVEIVRKGK